MTRMPSFDEIRDDFERGIRTAEQRIEHPFRHAHSAPQPPAARPDTQAAPAAANPQENTVSLSTIASDIKGAIENGDQWIKQVVDTHLPAILAEAQKYENSPIVQALEAALLPPALEQQIASMITELSKAYPAGAAPAQPQPSFQPAAPQQ